MYSCRPICPCVFNHSSYNEFTDIAVYFYNANEYPCNRVRLYIGNVSLKELKEVPHMKEITTNG